MYEDKIYVWNDGEMPLGLDSTDKLFMKHSSKPYNPKLVGAFFKSGMIEARGREFDKIREACAKYDAPLPEYNISASGIMVLCKACDKYLELLHGELHPVQREQEFAFPNRLYLKRHFLDEMIKNKKLKMTLPDKPSSKNQKYYS